MTATQSPARPIRHRLRRAAVARDRLSLLRFSDPDGRPSPAVDPGPPRPEGERVVPPGPGWPDPTRYLEQAQGGPVVMRRLWLWSPMAWQALSRKPHDAWATADGSRFVIRGI